LIRQNKKKMKNKILIVTTVLFGMMMVNAGLNKLFHYMPMPEMSPEMTTVMMALVTIKWILPLIATAEIFGGVLIAVPRYRALGAIVLLPVLTGILVHHVTYYYESGLGMAIALFAINIWVIIENRKKYLPMIKKLPRRIEPVVESNAISTSFAGKEA
jgi:putative oxidoreductase